MLINKYRLVPAASSPAKVSEVINSINSNESFNFEREIEAYLSIAYSRTFTSFMRSILGVLLYLKSKEVGKEHVVIPRFSCPTFRHAIINAGLKPIFSDLHPRYLSMNIDSIPNFNAKKTLALICVNHFGLVNDMDSISSFCKKNNIYLIEDLGYSFGSEYDGHRIGTFGDYSVLNFKEGKAVPIGGGMVTTNDKNFNLFFEDSQFSKSRNLLHLFYPLITNPYVYSIIVKISNLFYFNFRRKYTMEDTIHNSKNENDFNLLNDKSLKRINNNDLKVGKIFLRQLSESQRIRNKNAQKLDSIFRKFKFIFSISQIKGTTSIHPVRFPVLISKGLVCKVEKVMLKAGIETRRIYKEVLPEPRLYPGSKFVRDRILTFPTNHNLRKSDFKKIEMVLNEIQ